MRRGSVCDGETRPRHQIPVGSQREWQQRLDIHTVAYLMTATQLESRGGLNRHLDEIGERIVDADCQLLIGQGGRRGRWNRRLLRLNRRGQNCAHEPAQDAEQEFQMQRLQFGSRQGVPNRLP